MPIRTPPGVRVHAAAIRCQVRIEPDLVAAANAGASLLHELRLGRVAVITDEPRWGRLEQERRLGRVAVITDDPVGVDWSRSVAWVASP